MAMPCASSCSAAVTTSSTERLWPRWITSAPMPCRMRRMMLIAASWPSNRRAAVTKRTLLVGPVVGEGLEFGGEVGHLRVFRSAAAPAARLDAARSPVDAYVNFECIAHRAATAWRGCGVEVARFSAAQAPELAPTPHLCMGPGQPRADRDLSADPGRQFGRVARRWTDLVCDGVAQRRTQPPPRSCQRPSRCSQRCGT